MENINEFIDYIKLNEDLDLAELREIGELNHVPIIRKSMADFLGTLIQLRQPRRILEIGTAIGYSGILMAKALDRLGVQDYQIDTIERSEKMLSMAEKHFETYKVKGKIQQYSIEAERALESFVEEGRTYDFIFMDAAKGQYLTFYPYVIKLMNKGSVLVSDNVLQEGDVLHSRYNVARRQRTIHQRMREYIWEITNSPILDTSILDVADGITMSVKVR